MCVRMQVCILGMQLGGDVCTQLKSLVRIRGISCVTCVCGVVCLCAVCVCVCVCVHVCIVCDWLTGEQPTQQFVKSLLFGVYTTTYLHTS